MTSVTEDWLDAVRWNEQGLVPAVAQDATSGRLLMLAWMNRDALRLTVDTGRAVYWSRSRSRLWRKGERSGHYQRVRELRLDCDNDAILVRVDQAGGIACHTGRPSCFYQSLEGGHWRAAEAPVEDPGEIHG